LELISEKRLEAMPLKTDFTAAFLDNISWCYLPGRGGGFCILGNLEINTIIQLLDYAHVWLKKPQTELLVLRGPYTINHVAQHCVLCNWLTVYGAD
jgi:hypothetical protein